MLDPTKSTQTMDLVVDILLLLAALMLVQRSNSDRDDVWRLCLRMLAVGALLAVITSERGLLLSALLLIVALWLPGVSRLEKKNEDLSARIAVGILPLSGS